MNEYKCLKKPHVLQLLICITLTANYLSKKLLKDPFTAKKVEQRRRNRSRVGCKELLAQHLGLSCPRNGLCRNARLLRRVKPA